MSAYLGDFRTGKTVRKMWNSNAVAGESITRATNGTISVYKDGGTTQSTTGVTDTEDFDSLTGVHLVAVDTSADGTFYSAGSDFEVVLSAATIDGKAINATLFSFSLENRSALMPTTDGRKLDVSAGGEAGLDWANIGSKTTANDLSGTTVNLVNTATTLTNAPSDSSGVTTLLSRLSALRAGYLDNLSAGAAALESTAQAILADTGTDGVVVAAGSKSGYALSNTGIDAILQRDLTEAYSTVGGLLTVTKALYEIVQHLQERAIASATDTVKKRDQSTTAMTFTLDDATNPSSTTRAT